MDPLTGGIIDTINQSIDDKIDQLEKLREKLLAQFDNEPSAKKPKTRRSNSVEINQARSKDSPAKLVCKQQKGKSRYKHVSFNKKSKTKPYAVQIFRDKKSKYLGNFATQEEAVKSAADYLKVPVDSLLKKEKKAHWIGGRDLPGQGEVESNPQQF